MSPAWAAVLRHAADRFGFAPHETWALSLAEWRALAALSPAAAPLTRAELDALLLLHPDDAP